MSREQERPGVRHYLNRVIALQIGGVILVATIISLLWGSGDANSAIIGGAINVLAGEIHARWVIKSTGGTPEVMWRAHVVGEALKIVLTVVLFTLVVLFVKELQMLPMILGYGATLLTNWVALFLFKFDESQN